ncbi:hypothetical protein BH10ACT1_BH10ACT1_33910 [soil metagenome]
MAPAVHYLSHPFATGYGVAGRRLVLALVDLGVELSWTPIDFGLDTWRYDPARPVHPDLAPLRSRPIDADVVVVHAIPEVIPGIEHLRPPGAALVCHTVWEHVELQPHWPALLNRCDGVVVPTEWNAAAFADAGVTVPIAVVPHVASIDPEVDAAWLGPAGLDLGDRTVFHSLAAWNDRKQPGTTVDAFTRAFGPDDDVVLVLKTDQEIAHPLPAPPGPPGRRRLTSWSVATIVHRNHPAPDVRITHQSLSDAQVAALHRRSDCWLSLPHAEGWDLGAFDAATVGTPVITTDTPGPASYLGGSPLLVPGAPAPNPAVAGTTWVDPDLDAAIERLRAHHADPDPARRWAATHAVELRERYDPHAVAGQFLAAVSSML